MSALLALMVMGFAVSACGEAKPPQPPPPAPPEYADKHMPDGYWGNEEIIAQGKDIFIGKENIDVNCASCHGKDGKPLKAGARDFRKGEHMAKFSDAQWFWRVSEGIKGTKMKAWKSKLSEDDRWKVIAWESTFGLKGQEYSVAEEKWVALGTAKTAEEVAAEKAAAEEAAAKVGEPAGGEAAGEAQTEKAPTGEAQTEKAPTGEAQTEKAPTGEAPK